MGKKRKPGLTRRAMYALLFFIVFFLTACEGEKEPHILETFPATLSEREGEGAEGQREVIFQEYYRMSDNTWKTENRSYKYRLKLTGRLRNAVKDTTYIILSNTEEITFEEAWKASGLGSLETDYFPEEEAVIVGFQ